MSLPRPTDYGTPAKESDKYVTLEIDGVEVTVPDVGVARHEP